MTKVKKILNDPENIVSEVLDGYVAASCGALSRPEERILVRTDLPGNKVGLVIGGGSGHEPLYTAYVGDGFADASVAGNIFAAPAPQHVTAAIKAVDQGKGVLMVYGNYAGDVLNFDMGAEDATDETGVDVRTVLVADDAATEDLSSRRGIGGAFYQVRIAGAICREAETLDQAEAVVRRVVDNLRSLGVAVKAGSLPETGEPTFELGDDEIEIGLGMHGEVGVERTKLIPADELTSNMMDVLVKDLPFASGDRVAMCINNLGSTTQMELMIVARKAAQILKDAGIDLARTDVGSFCGSQEMAGFSISLLKLDDELERLLNSPCKCISYQQA